MARINTDILGISELKWTGMTIITSATVSEPLTKIKPVSSVLQPVSPRPFSGVCSVSIAPPQARGSGDFAPGVILTCLAHADGSHASLRVGPKAPRGRDATLTSQPGA